MRGKSDAYRIVVVPGDGIGPEVCEAAGISSGTGWPPMPWRSRAGFERVVRTAAEIARRRDAAPTLTQSLRDALVQA